MCAARGPISLRIWREDLFGWMYGCIKCKAVNNWERQRGAEGSRRGGNSDNQSEETKNVWIALKGLSALLEPEKEEVMVLSGMCFSVFLQMLSKDMLKTHVNTVSSCLSKLSYNSLFWWLSPLSLWNISLYLETLFSSGTTRTSFSLPQGRPETISHWIRI